MSRSLSGNLTGVFSERREAVFFACFAVLLFLFSHARGFSIAALADDVGVIRIAAQQALDGELWATTLNKWVSPLAAGGTMWRPLPVLSFALDALWYGDHTPYWRLTNIALHLLCAITTASVVRAFGLSRSAAAISFGVCLLLPWVPEVSIWIVGRYDGFATLFVLAAVLFALKSNGRDVTLVVSLAAAALAYASKESAATAVALVAAVLWLRDCRANSLQVTRPSKATIHLVVAHAVLLAIYMVWRQWLFQSVSLDLYATAAPSRGIVATIGSWFAHFTSARDYVSLAPAAAIIAGAFCLFALFAAVRKREYVFCIFAGLGFAAIVAGALAVVFPSPNTGSDGARIYHLMSVGFAIAIGAALAALSARTRVVCTMIVLLALASWQRACVEEWRVASNQLYRLQTEFPRIGGELSAQSYALIAAPDRIGRVPFARNANGALLLAYSGDRERISQMIISTDLGVWEWWKYSAEGVVRKHLTKREDAPAAPTQFYCFNGDSLQHLGHWQSSTQEAWDSRWRNEFARACPNLRYGR